MKRHYRNVYYVVIDEAYTSKCLGKLRVALRQQRLYKWNPAAGTKAHVTRGDGTEQQTFEVVDDKWHKLLAFRAHVKVNGVSQPRVIVTNRDEPTVYFSQILIYALLGAEPRRSPDEQTPQSSGRGQSL